jgi:hypothetical protein
MNNSELEEKLKSARGPALDADYQEKFPHTVLAGLRSAPRPSVPAHRSWYPRLAWAFATAFCILVAFVAGRWHGRMEAGQDVLADSKLIQETLAMFPNRVRAIVRDEHGMNLVLSDKNDVPASTPIYVRICDGQNCSSLVTFSGQEIQIDGRIVTVLSDAHGGIILEGDRFVWSSTGSRQLDRGLKIEARMISTKAAQNT